MYPNFAKKIVLQIYNTKVSTQKIDGFKLDIFNMVIVSFFIEGKERRSQFSKKIFY